MFSSLSENHWSCERLLMTDMFDHLRTTVIVQDTVTIAFEIRVKHPYDHQISRLKKMRKVVQRLCIPQFISICMFPFYPDP